MPVTADFLPAFNPPPAATGPPGIVDRARVGTYEDVRRGGDEGNAGTEAGKWGYKTIEME